MRTRLIWLSIIGLGAVIAWSTRPNSQVPTDSTTREEIVEASETRTVSVPAIKRNKPVPATIQEPQRLRKALPSSSISQRQIEDSIRADIYCNPDGSYKLDQKLFANEEDRRQKIFKSLAEISFRTKAFEDVLAALLSRQRDTVLALLADCPNQECLFLKGLVLTDQIEVKGNGSEGDVDIRKGLNILKTLKFMNRDNGIYTYFMLSPLQKLNEKYNLKLAFKDFLRATRFDNPIIRSYVALTQAGQFNATAHLYAEELYSVIGVPEYGQGIKVINELIKDKDFESELTPWAKNRLEDFAYIKAKELFSPAVLIVELATLKTIARNFWEKAGTGPAPDIFGTDGFREFMKVRTELPFDGSHLQEDARNRSHCLAVWDLKRETQSRYSTALSEMIHRWETP